MSGKLENILQNSPAQHKSMKNGDMVTEAIGDNITTYLKHNNALYKLKWEKFEKPENKNPSSEIKSKNYKAGLQGYKIKENGDADLGAVTSNSINNLKWKFFQGTSAIKQRFVTIPHGISRAMKKIVCVSVNIQSDTSPNASSGSIPTSSFLAGAGNIQDENDEDREFQTLYDDTNIYIFTDNTADDVAENQYTCVVFYTDYELY